MTTTRRQKEAAEDLKQVQIERNPGMALDMDWVHQVRVNLSAVERRAATIPTRRTVKKEWQAAWLLRAITCIDLTTLAGDDTPGNVQRLLQTHPPGQQRKGELCPSARGQAKITEALLCSESYPCSLPASSSNICIATGQTFNNLTTTRVLLGRCLQRQNNDVKY